MWIFKCHIRGDHQADNPREKSKQIKARAPFERKVSIHVSHVKKAEADVMLVSPSSQLDGRKAHWARPVKSKNTRKCDRELHRTHRTHAKKKKQSKTQRRAGIITAAPGPLHGFHAK